VQGQVRDVRSEQLARTQDDGAQHVVEIAQAGQISRRLEQRGEFVLAPTLFPERRANAQRQRPGLFEGCDAMGRGAGLARGMQRSVVFDGGGVAGEKGQVDDLGRDYCAVHAPSIDSEAPLMNAAAGEQR
jgi:hypothetical protein